MNCIGFLQGTEDAATGDSTLQIKAHHADTNDNSKTPQSSPSCIAHEENASKDAEAADSRDKGNSKSVRLVNLHDINH